MYRTHYGSLGICCILILFLMLLGSMSGSVLGFNEISSPDDDFSEIQLTPVGLTTTALTEEQIIRSPNVTDHYDKLGYAREPNYPDAEGTIENSVSEETEIPSIKTTPSQPEIYPSIGSQSKIKSFTIPVSFSEPRIITENGYSRIELADCTATGAPGEPELMAKVLNFKFKPLTEFNTIEFAPKTVITDSLPHQLQPIQEPIPLSLIDTYSKKVFDATLPDPSIYSVQEPYPKQWFSIDSGVGIDSDNDDTTLFVNIKLFPVRYIPTRNEFLYAPEGTLNIAFTPPPEKELNERLYSGLGIDNYVKDDDGVENSAQNSAAPSRHPSRDVNYRLLIIGPKKFEENLTKLADFKTSTDLPAIFVNITSINDGTYFTAFGRDQQEKIKYFIFNAKKSWNITDVILAGDSNQVPHRNVFIDDTIHMMAGNIPADLYYADVFDSELKFCDWDLDADNTFGEYINGEIDGTDMYPDVFLGRLPADSVEEMEILVNKIINYEVSTSGQPWFDNITMCGTNTFPGTSIPEGEYSCEYIYENYMQDFIPTKIYETTTYNRDLSCTTTNIINTLNKGCGFATFHDHGDPTSWAGKFSSTNAQSLTNGDKLPFLNFDACSTGRFDGQDCISEKVVLNPNGGSIISIGASRIGWGAWGTAHITRNSGYFNVHLYENYINGEGTAGRIFMGSKIQYLNDLGIGSYHDYMTLTEYTLFGDPSLSVGGIPLKNITISCEENTSYIAPSNSVFYDVTISNNGTLSRPIKLNVGGIPENWSATLNESLLIVPGMSEKKVSLNVTAADTALYEESAHVEVFAYSSKNKARTISIMTHTITTRIYGVDLNTTVFEDTVFPNEEAYYWFKVTNLGNAENVIELSANLTEPKEGWVFNLSSPDILVLPYSSQFIILRITPPEKTLFGRYDVEVIGRLFGLSIEDAIIVQTNISRTYGIEFTAEENKTRHYNPGENFTYHLLALNDGNDLDKVRLLIQRSPKTWNIVLSRPKPFNVNAFSQKMTEMYFEIPKQTVAGHYLIRLYAELVSNETHWAEIDIEIIVDRVYGLGAAINRNNAMGNPTETQQFNLSLNHTGNADDIVEVNMLNKPRDWYLNISNASLPIAAFTVNWILIKVTPNSKAIVGTYPFRLKVTLTGNNNITYFGLNITVRPVDGFEVRCLKNQFTVAPGDAQNFKLYVTNFGNHDDDIALNSTNLPPTWELTWNPQYLPVQNITLQPFNSTLVSIKLVTDSKAIAGTYTIPVAGKLKSTGEDIKLFLYLTLTPYYGVTLDCYDLKVRTHPGEEFEITINISNLGNIRDNITRTLTGIPSTWEIYSAIEYTYSQVGPYERKIEIIRIYVPAEEEERDVDIIVRIHSESEPDQNDQENPVIYIESKQETNPDKTFDWNDYEGMFMFWILPIILVIIIIIVMGFVIHRQRKEYKEDMKIIQDMQETESAHAYGQDATDIYAQPGEGTPTIPGAIPSAAARSRPKRTRRLHRPRSPKPMKPKTPQVGAGGDDKIRWLDEKSALAVLPTITSKSEEQKEPEEDITQIRCPKCDKLVNIDEYKCPYCGEIFEDFGDEKPKDTTSDDEYKVHLPGDEELEEPPEEEPSEEEPEDDELEEVEVGDWEDVLDDEEFEIETDEDDVAWEFEEE